MKIKTTITNIFYRYPLSLLVIGAIIYLSLFKPENSDLLTIHNIDKIAHLCMYGGLCSVIWFEYLRCHKIVNRKRVVGGAIVAPILFSGAIELIQGMGTEHRSGDWLDFFFNVLGVVLACVASKYIIGPIIKKYNLYRKKHAGRKEIV